MRRLRLVFETGRRGRVRSVSAKVVLPNATNDLFAAAGSDPYPYTQYPDIFSHTPRNRTGRNPTTGDGVTLGEYCDGLGIVIGRKANGLTVAHELGHQLGLDDCYPVCQVKIGSDYVTTYLHCFNEVVNKSTFKGKRDWGQETGRGYYGSSDTHGVILEKLLMYGFNDGASLDIPDGSVYSLRNGTTNSCDTTCLDVGADKVKNVEQEVYTR